MTFNYVSYSLKCFIIYHKIKYILIEFAFNFIQISELDFVIQRNK